MHSSKPIHLFIYFPIPPRTARDSDDDDDDDRKVSRGCALQYQRAQVKVLTQFHTTSTEGTNQVITMLGPDWQVDVTDLVQDSLKVADARVAELVDRTVLVGLELGSTSLKVSQPRLSQHQIEYSVYVYMFMAKNSSVNSDIYNTV